MDDVKDRLGRRIRQLRQLNNLTQEQLAELADLNPTYLGQVERGSKSPTIDTLCKIAKALNISLSELMAFDSDITVGDSTNISLNELLLEYSDKIRKLFEK